MIELLATSSTFLVICTTLLGLLVGSFLNVVIYRLPIMMEREFKGQCRHWLADELIQKPPAEAAPAAESEGVFNLFLPRSRCPTCKSPITASQNIPILSYLLQKGKCAVCASPISKAYPIVEAITGVLSLLVAIHYGVSWQCLGGLLLTWSLIALTVIDFNEQLLPDDITLPLLWCGLLFSYYGTFTDLASAVIGAMAGYLSLWSVYWLFKLLTKKEGMGYGDFKLLAMLGAWLGWQMLPIIVLLSSLVGAVVGIGLIALRGRDRNIPIPFGPYLAAAGWLALFWGHDITRYYLQISGIATN